MLSGAIIILPCASATMGQAYEKTSPNVAQIPICLVKYFSFAACRVGSAIENKVFDLSAAKHLGAMIKVWVYWAVGPSLEMSMY